MRGKEEEGEEKKKGGGSKINSVLTLTRRAFLPIFRDLIRTRLPCVSRRNESAQRFLGMESNYRKQRTGKIPVSFLFHVDEVEVIKYMVMTVTIDMESSPGYGHAYRRV